MAHYEPQWTRADIIDDFKKARNSASVMPFDPSGIETVRKFCVAPRHHRIEMDLSAIPSSARALLLTMSDDELEALSKAGAGQIKKFLDGKQHGVNGVPVVGVHKAVSLKSPRSPLDHRIWADVARRRRTVEAQFKLR